MNNIYEEMLYECLNALEDSTNTLRDALLYIEPFAERKYDFQNEHSLLRERFDTIKKRYKETVKRENNSIA